MVRPLHVFMGIHLRNEPMLQILRITVFCTGAWLWVMHAAHAGEATAAMSLEQMEEVAAQGVVEAQVELGLRLLEGRGMTRNPFGAMEWFFKAAARGSSEAQYQLGRMYAHGIGVLRNERRALRWLRRAARQGHVLARREIARLWQRMALQKRYKPLPDTRYARHHRHG